MNAQSLHIKVYEVDFKTRTLPDVKEIGLRVSYTSLSENYAQQVYFVRNYTGGTDVSPTNRKPLHLPRAVTLPPTITDVH